MERVPRNRPGPYADPSDQRPCDERHRGRRPAGTYFRRTDRHAGTRRTADEDRVPEYPTEDGSQGSFRAIALLRHRIFRKTACLAVVYSGLSAQTRCRPTYGKSRTARQPLPAPHSAISSSTGPRMTKRMARNIRMPIALAAAQQFVEQIPTNKSRVGTDPHELRNGIDRVLKIRETLRTGMSRLHYEFYVPNLNGKGEA